MNFPDFLDFEPFNTLREKMGAHALGHFEFFDPLRHLTAGERSELVTGVSAPIHAIRILDDGTLAWKNSRVLAYRLKPVQPDDWEYHLAECEIFSGWQQGEEVIGLASAVPQSDFGRYRVCSHCLHQLRYKGFDGVRQRHRQYAIQVQESFNLAEFFQHYPLYPLRETVVKPLF